VLTNAATVGADEVVLEVDDELSVPLPLPLPPPPHAARASALALTAVSEMYERIFMIGLLHFMNDCP
jgi:hypothetical protein